MNILIEIEGRFFRSVPRSDCNGCCFHKSNHGTLEYICPRRGKTNPCYWSNHIMNIPIMFKEVPNGAT